MEETRDVKSLLSIKVLRLMKPSLVGPLCLTADRRDLVQDLWEKEIKSDVTSVPDIEALSLGNFLRIPQGFGNLYLGETFASYVIVQNESPILVTDVNCKVELQTQTQKFILADKRGIQELKTGSTIDLVMNHEIKEMGKYMLVVTLSYSVQNLPTPEPISVERYFKFQVKKPLDVKTKLYNAENDEVFLEAQVQNITAGTICLEKVELEPSPAFTCIPMNNPDRCEIHLALRDELFGLKLHDKPVWPTKILDVDSSYQYLYRLVPKIEHARAATNIGKLDIIWRTSLGDKGRLQTSQLQRQPPVLSELRLTINKLPDLCKLDEPFEANVRIINTTMERELDLHLELDQAGVEGYCWLGLTKTKLGTLSATKNLDIPLAVFPLRTGLINLTGIRITDLKRGEKFFFNDFAQVFILQ